MRQADIKKHTLRVMAALAVLLLVWAAFGGRGDATMAEYATEPDLQEASTVGPEVPAPVSALPQTDDKKPAAGPAETPREETRPDNGADNGIMAILTGRDTVRSLNRYEAHYDSMPPGGRKIRINSVGPLRKAFNDSNYLHIASARKLGVEPVHGIDRAWRAGGSLTRLNSCEAYYLDQLTHSLPYLVPEAHRLLTDIGTAFRDSLRARGGGDYRIKVTSVLRTPSLVKRLRRRNRNAVDTSAHLYGTTFDISYAKFICNDPSVPRTQEDMKNLLAEVIWAMREQGRCYVKYEYKQACFHITAR